MCAQPCHCPRSSIAATGRSPAPRVGRARPDAGDGVRSDVRPPPRVPQPDHTPLANRWSIVRRQVLVQTRRAGRPQTRRLPGADRLTAERVPVGPPARLTSAVPGCRCSCRVPRRRGGHHPRGRVGIGRCDTADRTPADPLGASRRVDDHAAVPRTGQQVEPAIRSGDGAQAIARHERRRRRLRIDAATARKGAELEPAGVGGQPLVDRLDRWVWLPPPSWSRTIEPS